MSESRLRLARLGHPHRLNSMSLCRTYFVDLTQSPSRQCIQYKNEPRLMFPFCNLPSRETRSLMHPVPAPSQPSPAPLSTLSTLSTLNTLSMPSTPASAASRLLAGLRHLASLLLILFLLLLNHRCLTPLLRKTCASRSAPSSAARSGACAATTAADAAACVCGRRRSVAVLSL